MRFSMPVRDLFMILSSFMAMIAGAFLPQLAEPLAFLPRICLMLLLYLGFLSVGTEALFAQARIMPGRILEFVVLRLAILPLFAFAVFQVLMPSFALGALLVAASCVGVVAPVFSNMVRANTPFILVSCLVTSLLLPASLPALLYVVDTGMQILHIGKLPLPPDLREALEEYDRLSGFEAKRRQLQYIGRLMREAREEGTLQPVLDALAVLE